MKLHCTPFLLAAALLLAATSAVRAQMEVVAGESMQTVFAEAPQKVRAVFHNVGKQSEEITFQTRIYQVSSGGTMPVEDAKPWKKLQVLAGQTVLESAELTFPPVKTGTRFQIAWLDEKGRKVGAASVMVYPPDLLKQLKTLAGEKPIGLWDPENQIKPLLKKLEVEFEDLEAGEGLRSYQGKLAIAGPFSEKNPMPSELVERMTARAKDGVAIVWIRSASEDELQLAPSAHIVRHGTVAIVVAQPATVGALAESPLAQLSLIRFAEWALNPELLQLPNVNQP